MVARRAVSALRGLRPQTASSGRQRRQGRHRGYVADGTIRRLPAANCDRDGTQRRGRRLTHRPGVMSNSVSSPDARSVAFVTGGAGGGGGRGGAGAGGGQTLYTVVVDSGTVTRVAQATPQP